MNRTMGTPYVPKNVAISFRQPVLWQRLENVANVLSAIKELCNLSLCFSTDIKL